MIIGINAMAALTWPRTGVEEYAYQLIKHLAMLKKSKKHRFLLYSGFRHDIKLPKNFQFTKLRWPLPMWTQIRLAYEMFFNKPDILFIPVHILPLIHPKNSIVVIHGLEYEYYPEMYQKKHLSYLRWSTKYALKNSRKIIAVSENTKKDLVNLYGGNPDKIKVVYHGVGDVSFISAKAKIQFCPYILYIGRIEIKKNVQGLIQAFNLLKKKYKIPHKLVLAGCNGYGFDKILLQDKDIIFTGYVSEQQKWQLLKEADCFVFPSFYEGFGMPILEAQKIGCPVVCSNISSMPEVAGDGVALINPKSIEEISDGIYKIISDKIFKNGIIEKGYQNVKRFSWQKCAEETLKVIIE
ncbi:glycosyltransferase family 4 protein [Patescibacteria group bacterium]